MLAGCSGGSSGNASSPASPTVTLTASPTSLYAGSTTTLTWSTTAATSCTASGGWSGAKATSGTAASGALGATTSFTLSCSGASGTTPAATTVTVTVNKAPQAPTVSLTASPPGVTSGGAATLTWSTTAATSCTASGGWSGTQATSGSASSGVLTETTSYTLTCTGGGGSAAATATVSITNPNGFTVSPANAALTLSQSQQFTASAPGGGALVWSVDGVAGGSPAVGTISASGLYAPPANPGTHTVLATSALDPALSGSAAIAVTDLAGVYTFHNDLARTGQNLKEYALTPSAVSSGAFGKRWACAVDGDVYAQPLYVANLAIAGGTHNVLFVATQHDSVYAFDADDPGCSTYWHVSTLFGGATTIPPSDISNHCVDIPTEFGITGTPVIDPSSETLYFVAASKEGNQYVQRLHALELSTGIEQAGSPVAIQASVPTNAGGTVSFSALWQNQRPALALTGGGVYIGWSSHCDDGTYWGWVMRYDAASLAQTAVFNDTPNGSLGGIWMSAGAPAVDSAGRLFLTTGNGSFDDSTSTLPPVAPNNDFSMSFLNLNPTTLAVADFYTPSMEASWSNDDLDISSSGVTVLPDGSGPSAHPDLLVGSDKQAHLWLIDRTSMGRFSSIANNTVQYLTLPDSVACDQACGYDTPAYYNGTVYVGLSVAPLMALPLTNGLFSATAQDIAVPSSLSAETYGFPGPTPMISASPAGGAIVWVLDNSVFQDSTGNSSPAGPAILRAYAAGNLATTLYSSATLAADTAGNAVKFTVPVIANGHVYVGGGHQVTVYGLAP